VSRVKQILDAK